MLTAKDINALEPRAKPYKVQDSRNLFLRVDPTGKKYWIANIDRRGKRTSKSLGSWPDVSALDARRAMDALGGEDAKALAGSTFKEWAEKWHKLKQSRLTSTKYALQIAARLETDVYPAIGGKDIATLKRRELMAVVAAVADRGAVETAHRLAQYICQILDYAVDCGEIDSHAGSGLVRVLPAAETKHHAALSWHDAGPLFKAMWGYDGGVVVAGALRILAMCVPRAQELAGARWAEIGADVWVIPAERMKRKLPHVVPLATQVRAEFDRLRAVTGAGDYVFSTKKGHMHAETPAKAIRDLGFAGVQTEHGMRTIFSSAANESGLWSADAIERQLSHRETDAVRAAYHRAEYLEERRRLMQWWADAVAALV